MKKLLLPLLFLLALLPILASANKIISDDFFSGHDMNYESKTVCQRVTLDFLQKRKHTFLCTKFILNALKQPSRSGSQKFDFKYKDRPAWRNIHA